MSNHREELASFILDRTRSVTADCRTFLWFKTLHSQEYHSAGILGGGNLMCAMSLFVNLEYLSKIHYVLRTGKKINNKKEWKKPLEDLVYGIPINLGISTLGRMDLHTFWESWRHKLAHLLAQDPKWGIVRSHDRSTLRGLDFEQAQKLVVAQVAFRKEQDGRWCCNVEKFSFDIDSIADWVAAQLELYDDRRIALTLGWLLTSWN